MRLSAFVCLFVGVCFYLGVWVDVCVIGFIPLRVGVCGGCMRICVYVYRWVSLRECVSVCLCVWVSLCVCLSVCVPLCLCVWSMCYYVRGVNKSRTLGIKSQKSLKSQKNPIKNP